MGFRFLLFLACICVSATAFTQVQYAARLNEPSAINLQKPVGTVDGTLGVSSSGGASYTIPIKVPLGINGMEPKLAIAYNSQGSNGLLGFGWTLSGLSAITRNPNDIIHDGICKPIEWNNNDQYYLDGSKLISISGNHGNHNTVYTTEQEVGTRVTQQWIYNQTSSPSWFSVKTKDGGDIHYGELGNSRQFASHNGEILCWKINSTEDINGNKVTYEYQNYGSEHVLRKISYGFIANVPRYTVLLHYDNRRDENKTFIAGSSSHEKLLLVRIQIVEFSTGSTIKEYKIEYAWDGFHSVLQAIRELGTDNVSEYNETQFIYGDEGNTAIPVPPAFGSQWNIPRNIEDNPVSGLNYMDVRVGIGRGSLVGDFNGDGTSDIAEKVFTFNAFPGDIKSLQHLSIKIKDPNSGDFTQEYVLALNLAYSNNESIKAFRDENFLVGDVDGDGTDDIIIGIRKAGYDNKYNRLEKLIFITNLNKYVNGVLTPTIQTEYTTTAKNMIMDELNPTPTDVTNNNYMYLADFDGNGLVDLLTALSPEPWENSDSYLQITTFRHFDPRTGQIDTAKYFQDIDVSGVNFSNGQGNIAFPDFNYRSFLVSPFNFNGGLKQELLVINNAKTYIYDFEKQGNVFRIKELFNAGYPTQWHRTTLGDFNGDGNTDLLVRAQSQNTWEIAYSTGINFDRKSITLCKQPETYYPTSSHVSPYNTRIVISDMNNDGLSDISYINDVTHISGSGSTTRYRHSNELVINYNKGSNIFDCHYNTFVTTNDSLYPIRGENQLLGDFNGDGKLDILWHVGLNLAGSYLSVKKYITIGKFKNEYTMRSVRNGLGMVNHIGYLPLTTNQDVNHYHFSGNLSSFWPLNRLKIPLWTVHKIGRYTDATANVTSEVYYRYDDLYVLKDGRGMLGFGVTFTHDVKTGAIKKSFNGGFAPFGRYLPDHTGIEVGYISGNVYTKLNRTDNYRRYQSILTNKTYSLQEYRNTQTDFQSNTEIITNTEFDNNVNNNPIEITTQYPGLFTTKKAITYAPATDTRTTLPFKPQTVEETSTRQGAPPVITKARYEYQNGRLHKEIIHDGLPNAITKTYSYNNFGNLTSQIISAGGVPSRTESYEYDPAYRFRIKMTNALGQSDNTKYDAHWGVITEHKAFGGLTTKYEYDPFLRLKKTIFPEGYDITENLFWETGPVNYINQSRYRKETNSLATGKTKTMFNVFGQVLKEIGDLWNVAGSTSQYIIEKGYDDVGRIVYETPKYGSNDNNAIGDYYRYDQQGRVKEVNRHYNGLNGLLVSTTNIAYNYVNGNLKVETAKPSGAVVYTLTDATGKVVESKDENGIVKFIYDSWGNTWKTILNTTTVLTNTYDIYNLHRGINDISAGYTAYEYNALGQLIKQKDPLQNQTTFEYDLLGRKKSVTFPEGKLSYEYYNDPNQAKGNQLRSELRTNSGGSLEEKREYLYNSYGRVEKATYSQANLPTKFTSYGYDGFGRVNSTTLSSGISYTTEYNTGSVWRIKQGNNLVFQVKDINGHGQATEILRGDGLTSTHTYEFGQLLRKLVPGYQDYELTIDLDRGLITRRRDHLANRHEDFTYDALKLATATVGANGPIVPLPPQTQVYGTNSLTVGNLESKSDIGNFSYAQHKLYYTNNLAGAIPAQRQDITYASYKRPLTIKENGNEVQIEYGTDGERRVMRFYGNGTLQYTKHYLPDGVEILQDRVGAVTTVTPLPGTDGVGAYMINWVDPRLPSFNISNTYFPYPTISAVLPS